MLLYILVLSTFRSIFLHPFTGPVLVDAIFQDLVSRSKMVQQDVGNNSGLDFTAEVNDISDPVAQPDFDDIDGLDATADIANMLGADGELNVDDLPDAFDDSAVDSKSRLAKGDLPHGAFLALPYAG